MTHYSPFLYLCKLKNETIHPLEQKLKIGKLVLQTSCLLDVAGFETAVLQRSSYSNASKLIVMGSLSRVFFRLVKFTHANLGGMDTRNCNIACFTSNLKLSLPQPRKLCGLSSQNENLIFFSKQKFCYHCACICTAKLAQFASRSIERPSFDAIVAILIHSSNLIGRENSPPRG